MAFLGCRIFQFAPGQPQLLTGQILAPPNTQCIMSVAGARAYGGMMSFTWNNYPFQLVGSDTRYFGGKSYNANVFRLKKTGVITTSDEAGEETYTPYSLDFGTDSATFDLAYSEDHLGLACVISFFSSLEFETRLLVNDVLFYQTRTGDGKDYLQIKMQDSPFAVRVEGGM
jgi:hypothetical protein